MATSKKQVNSSQSEEIDWVIRGAAVSDARRLEVTLLRKRQAHLRWERGQQDSIASVLTAFVEVRHVA